MKSTLFKTAPVLLIVTLLSFLLNQYSFLLFHTVAEFSSIVIAFTIFTFAWHTRRQQPSSVLLFMGICYLFVGVIDLTHALSYKGMNIFIYFDENLPTQLWIIARYMESLSLLIAFFFIGKKISVPKVFTSFCLITIMVFLSLFIWKIFPDCFIEGTGLTPFKKISEYVISLILLASLSKLWKHRSSFSKNILTLMSISIVATIVTELLFTFYVSVYGISNLFGHLFKVFSFYCIYKAILSTGLEQPLELLYQDLRSRELDLENTNAYLDDIVKERTSKLTIALNKLTASEEVLTQAQELSKTGHFEYDIRTKTIIGSQEFYRILGLSQSTHYTKDLFKKIIHPEDLDLFLLFLKNCVEQGDSFDLEYRCYKYDTSELIYVTTHSRLLRDDNGGAIKVVGVTQDITERKTMEDKNREQAKLLDLIFEHSLDSIVLLDRDYNFIRVSDAYAHSCQRKVSEFPGNNHFDFYPSPLKDEFDVHKADKSIYKISERPFTFPDHPEWDTTYWNLGLVPILDIDNELEFFIFTLKDVTEEVVSRNKLIESEERYRVITESAINSICQIELDGKISFINSTGKKMYGIDTTDNLNLTDIFPDHSLIQENEILNNKMGKSNVFGELTAQHLDGHQFPVKYSIKPIYKNGDISGYICNTRDMTEVEIMEKQLRQSQKMNAIGQLSGGIAHDFNNILAIIISFTEMAVKKCTSQQYDELNSDLKNILVASDRAVNLVKQILTFSRQNKPQMEVTSLQQLIDEVRILLNASLPSSIHLEVKIENDTPLVFVEPTQLHETVVNLATNASHAMNSKGDIYISLYKMEVSDPLQGIIGEILPGVYSVIKIQDNGVGMDQELISHIFEPFFTTKGKGKGTGLGLSVVYGIMESHNGNIQIESSPSSGTTFKLFIPKTLHELPQKKSKQIEAPKGTEHILFVDDEPMLCKVGSEILTSLGYTVTSTVDSLNALELFEKSPEKYDILITDQTMPLLTGVELINEVKKIRDDIPIILCTGYSSNDINTSNNDFEINYLVNKPLKVNDLAITVRKALK